MKIAIPKERRLHERRVAASPETVKKLIGLGFEVTVEKSAGDGASIPDADYAEAGAALAADEAAALKDADIVLKVQAPLADGEDGADEIAMMKRGAILIGSLAALQDKTRIAAYENAGLTVFSLEL